MGPSIQQRARLFLQDSAERCPPEAQQLLRELVHELDRQRPEEDVERLRMAVAGAELGVWDHDLARGTVVWNDHLYDMIGMPRGTPVDDDTLFAHIHPDDLPQARARVADTIESGRDLLMEFRIVREDGEIRWILDRGRVYRNTEGKGVRMSGISQDITEKKESEAALRDLNETLEDLFTVRTAELRRSEELYRNLVESANSIVLRWKLDGTITFINRFGRNFFGYQIGELLGQPIIGTLASPVDDGGRDMRRMLKDIADRPHMYVDNENENRRRNGERVWVYWTNRAIRDEHGKVVEILSIGNDRTLQHQAEAALRESEHRFRAVFQNANDGILLTDQEKHTVLAANPAACKLFGYTEEEMGHLDIADIHPAETLPEVHERFKAQGRGESRITHNAPVKRKDGNTFYVDISSFPISVDGQRCVAAIFRDVTARRRAEQELVRQKERLRQLASSLAAAQDDEQQRIATGLHDNVAQWLVGASLKLALLRNLQPCPEAGKVTDELENLLGKATECVRSLSFELGSSTLHRLGLEAGIRELCQAIGDRHGLHFQLVDDQQPKPLSAAVSTVLFKCTRELLFNVVKHAGVERATVYLRREGGEVAIIVEDRGQGIQEDDVDSEPSIGNGLGLFAINERMRDIGGTLTADSVPGRETRMTLRAPLEVEEVE